MKTKIIAGVRILFGLMFVVFGLNGFLQFLPMPSVMPEAAKAFAGALMATHYMFPMIKGVEVICGLMLLTNMWVPLALALLAPNVVNIFLFHLYLEPSGLPMAIGILVAELFLAWENLDKFGPMLKRK
jgi:putative oxidoreductase